MDKVVVAAEMPEPGLNHALERIENSERTFAIFD
jgi:hypothetical protein